MEIESIVYPGFNKNLKELNAISKLKKHGIDRRYFKNKEKVALADGF